MEHHKVITLLVLPLLLLHGVLCVVYTVTPDDHYYPNTTCHHCHNLQHYLLNITKYFTSSTQLLFLPGLHHLRSNLIIKNVHNISLIGNTATLDTVVIQCGSSHSSSSGLLLRNIFNITIKNLMFQECIVKGINERNYKDNVSIKILNCLCVYMKNVTIISVPHFSIVAINVLEFSLFNIKSKSINILNTDLDKNNHLNSSPIWKNHTTLNIDNFTLIPQFKPIDSDNLDLWGLPTIKPVSLGEEIPKQIQWNDDGTIDTEKFNIFTIYLLQTSYNVSIKITNTLFHELNGYKAISINIKNCNSLIKNTISVTGCTFKGNSSSSTSLILVFVNIILCNNNLTAGENFLILQNCLFHGNIYAGSMLKIYTLTVTQSIPMETQTNMILHIIGCSFQMNVSKFIEFYGTWLHHASLMIDNTSFVKAFAENEAIVLSGVKLVFKGPVTFSEITTNECLLCTNSRSDIIFYSYIEFSNIKTTNLIYSSSSINFNIMENAYIKIADNKISEYLFHILKNRNRLYDFCHFQFYRISNKNYSSTMKNKKQLIEITSENGKQNLDRDAGNINCKWYKDSQYYHSGLTSNPLKVYSMHFNFINSSNNTFQFTTGPLCKCQDSHKNCYTNLLDPIYPGQTLKLTVSLNHEKIVADKLPISVKVYDNDLPHTICQVSSLLEAEQEIYQNCTDVTYNILSENTHHCKLILYNVDYDFPTVYYIKLLKCPAGFSYSILEKKCICDKKLYSEQYLPIKICNINDQTILRPANSWISATTHNSSYTYRISLHCPFHYCLPHSSHLNFSTPNSQCQFNRSGLLCGHCQQGLSTVFSSLNCQRCSNRYLLLIIPIALIAFIMVFLLFYLNLTITDGTINAFILYVNIISINSSIFFT